MNPTPVCHFGAPLQAVPLYLRRPDLEAVGFLHEAALQAAPVDPYLGEGDVASAAFQRGFAERIGETHLNQGLKLRACSDALIATAGYSPLLLCCASWERLSELLMATNTHTVCRNTFVTSESETFTKNLPSGTRLPSLGSETSSSANTWQPYGIIKTGHAPPSPSPRSLATVSASSTSANHTYSTICLEWH